MEDIAQAATTDTSSVVIILASHYKNKTVMRPSIFIS